MGQQVRPARAAAAGRRAMVAVATGVLVVGGLLVAVGVVGPRAAVAAAAAAKAPALSISPLAGPVGTVVKVTGYAPGACQGIMFAPDVPGAGGDVLFPASMFGQPRAFSASVVIPTYVGGATLEPPNGAHRVGHVVTAGSYVFELACNRASGPPITVTDSFAVTSATVPSGRFMGMAATADGGGYWLAQAGGGVYSYGNASFYGSLPGIGVTPAAPIVGIARTPDGKGYWLVGADGGVFAFGDAEYFGSYTAQEAQSADLGAGHFVGLVPSTGGGGYTEASVNGGLYNNGDATLRGSGGLHANTFIAAMAAATGGGAWEVGTDGGVFSIGNAPYEGSLPGDGVTPAAPIDAIVGTPDGTGYWLLGADGGVFAFGDAGFFGSAA